MGGHRPHGEDESSSDLPVREPLVRETCRHTSDAEIRACLLDNDNRVASDEYQSWLDTASPHLIAARVIARIETRPQSPVGQCSRADGLCFAILDEASRGRIADAAKAWRQAAP